MVPALQGVEVAVRPLERQSFWVVASYQGYSFVHRSSTLIKRLYGYILCWFSQHARDHRTETVGRCRLELCESSTLLPREKSSSKLGGDQLQLHSPSVAAKKPQFRCLRLIVPTYGEFTLVEWVLPQRVLYHQERFHVEVDHQYLAHHIYQAQVCWRNLCPSVRVWLHHHHPRLGQRKHHHQVSCSCWKKLGRLDRCSPISHQYRLIRDPEPAAFC